MSENFLRFLIGILGALNMWLCFYHWFTKGNIRSMILEAMLGTILYITFLLLEEEDDGSDDDDNDSSVYF